MNKWLFSLFLIIFLTACTTAQPDQAPATLSPTETIALPTPTLVDEPILFGEVTFDGKECTVAGPEEVSRGLYYFILNDESDTNLQLWLNQILEGKTFEDLLDWQEEPGVYRPAPNWIEHPRSMYFKDVDTIVHYLDQVGTYAILLGSYDPASLWFCEPFRVVQVGTK